MGKRSLPIPLDPELLSRRANRAATSEGTAAGEEGEEEESIRKNKRLASAACDASRIQERSGPIACGLNDPPRRTGATGGTPHFWKREQKCETVAERANLRKAAAEAGRLRGE